MCLAAKGAKKAKNLGVVKTVEAAEKHGDKLGVTKAATFAKKHGDKTGVGRGAKQMKRNVSSALQITKDY